MFVLDFSLGDPESYGAGEIMPEDFLLSRTRKSFLANFKTDHNHKSRRSHVGHKHFTLNKKTSCSLNFNVIRGSIYPLNMKPLK